jgi:microsomal epoxide hydrolase
MEKFVCKIDPKIIYDLNNQISKNRIINWAPDYNDQAGISFDDLSYILDYWKNKFSWTNEEEKLNKFNQYVFQYDNVKTHFLHIKSNHKNSIPLLLIHGWPGSIFEFNDLIPLLTSPDKNDLKDHLAFDLIIPSLPNVGFSFSPKQKPLDLNGISKHFIKLMKTLDYQKYFIQGGDLGSFIASIMAVNVPKEVMGIHLNLLPLPRGLNKKPNNIEEENYYEKLRYFMKYETGYQQIQGTKPFTLAHALNASPVALCSYISEKFYTWTDNKGSLFSHINIDTMLANISLYWITGCIGASFWPYYARHRSDWPIDIDNPIKVPMGYSEFPKEIFSPPNSLASQFYKNILLWEKHNSGGHFAAMEKPKELASDVNKFVKDVI